MELMDMKDYDIDFKEKRTNGYLIATLFIIVGILFFLLRNLGMIDPSLFDLFLYLGRCCLSCRASLRFSTVIR